MENPIRVLVVDDHLVVRKGVCALLGGALDIAVVGEAGDGLQAVAEASRCAPQVILMDLKLPRLDGVEAIRRILASQPETGIIVLTGTDVEADVMKAVRAGAVGYLTKTSRREDFLEAIRQVSRGEAWLPPRLMRKLLVHLEPRPASAMHLLTGRESEVLALLARGLSNRSIARELAIGEVTVRTYVSHILGKLGVSNRVEAALHALHGMGEPAGDDLLARVVEAFLQQGERDIAALRQALSQGDGATLAETAHGLAGSAALLGASVLARLAGELARGAREGELDACPSLLREVVREFEAAALKLSS